MYEYAAQLNRVIDGDTCVLDIDLGFHVTIREHVRLLRIDCPEIGTQAGKDARDFAAYWFQRLGGHCLIRTTKAQPQSFTRWLAEVESVFDPPSNLADALTDAGYVKEAP